MEDQKRDRAPQWFPATEPVVPSWQTGHHTSHNHDPTAIAIATATAALFPPPPLTDHFHFSYGPPASLESRSLLQRAILTVCVAIADIWQLLCCRHSSSKKNNYGKKAPTQKPWRLIKSFFTVVVVGGMVRLFCWILLRSSKKGPTTRNEPSIVEPIIPGSQKKLGGGIRGAAKENESQRRRLRARRNQWLYFGPFCEEDPGVSTTETVGRLVKAQTIGTPPTVGKFRSGRLRIDFCQMLRRSRALVSVSRLKDSRSQTGNFLGHHKSPISEFFRDMKRGEYIQQEVMDQIGFSRKEQHLVKEMKQMFHSDWRTWVHPAFRSQELVHFHGPQVFVGPGDIRVSLHFDRYWTSGSKDSFESDPGRHNVSCQLEGHKKWILFPPIEDHEAEKQVFQPTTETVGHPHVSRIKTLVVDKDWDALKVLFPEFVATVWENRVEVVLQPGDVLHIPPRWWHSTVSLDSSVAVNWWFSLGGENTAYDENMAGAEVYHSG